MNPFLDVALRSLAVYFFMFAAIRVFGKNQLSQLNAGDIVLLLLISNAVQNAMVGSNVSLEGGLVAALVLFGANFIVKKIIFKILGYSFSFNNIVSTRDIFKFYLFQRILRINSQVPWP